MSDSKSNPDFLDLPDANGYVEEELYLPIATQIKLMEEMLPYWNKDRFSSLENVTCSREPFYL